MLVSVPPAPTSTPHISPISASILVVEAVSHCLQVPLRDRSIVIFAVWLCSPSMAYTAVFSFTTSTLSFFFDLN